MFDVKLIDAKQVKDWLTLLFEFTFSGTASFLGACGFFLVNRAGVAFSVGAGMLSAFSALTIVFLKSPLTKGMIVAIPVLDTPKEAELTTQTIERNEPHA